MTIHRRVKEHRHQQCCHQAYLINRLLRQRLPTEESVELGSSWQQFTRRSRPTCPKALRRTYWDTPRRPGPRLLVSKPSSGIPRVSTYLFSHGHLLRCLADPPIPAGPRSTDIDPAKAVEELQYMKATYQQWIQYAASRGQGPEHETVRKWVCLARGVDGMYLGEKTRRG